MWRWAKGFGCCTAVLALACGGRVDGGSKDPGESELSKSPAPSSTASSSSSSSSSGTDNPDANTDLGACVRGPLEYAEPDKPCAWVAENRCYDTREMACNCACPRSHNSQCASGFDDGPDGHVWVACD
jgi:hypothetical protein